MLFLFLLTEEKVDRRVEARDVLPGVEGVDPLREVHTKPVPNNSNEKTMNNNWSAGGATEQLMTYIKYQN